MAWFGLLGKRTPQQVSGDAGEDLALAWLRQKGMTLVMRNFRCKGGEIDLVMQHGETLVFVEVRKRADRSHGGAAASITRHKQARLTIAAHIYLQRYRMPPPCRFDVIAIDDGEIEWLQDAIAG